jgi:hypothetical protein
MIIAQFLIKGAEVDFEVEGTLTFFTPPNFLSLSSNMNFTL